MIITINGTIRELDQELSITELLQDLDLPPDGIAVALNGSVVLRKEHPKTILQENDTIEIIRAVAGG